MPFDPVEESGNFIGIPRVEPKEEEDVGFSDALGAAFRSENTVGSFLASSALNFSTVPFDEEVDPFAEIAGSKYEAFAERFSGARNLDHVEAIKTDIDREMVDRETLSNAGAAGIAASMAAGFFDLPTLLPAGAAINTSRAGFNVLSVAGRTAAAGAVEAGISEAALQATQQTRTAGETALNIGGSVVLSGILGAGIGALMRRAEVGELAPRVERDFNIPADNEIDPYMPGPIRAPVGAAIPDDVDNTLKNALGAEQVLRFQDPTLRTMTSSSEATRRVGQELYESPLVFDKNADGFETAPLGSQMGAPGSVEARTRLWQAPLADAITFMDDQFIRYRKGRGKRIGDVGLTSISDKIRGPGGQLDYVDFKIEVAKAMRRGDEHDIPEVAATAKQLRKTVFDPLKDEAIAAKLLDEDIDVTTALSYLNRVYNTQKIRANRDGFKARVVSWLRKERDQADEGSDFADRSDAEIDSRSEEIIERILGTPDGRLPYDGNVKQEALRGGGGARVNVAGPLKQREFNIPDELIEDFLENDVEHLLRVYVRSVAPDVELTKRFGSVDMTDQLKEIIEDYNARIARASDEKEKLKLDRQKKADIRDIAGVRDRLRGTFGIPDEPEGILARSAQVVRSINYLRLLGGMTISAFPDLAQFVLKHGLTRTFRDGLVPVMRNWSGARLAAQEVKLAGTALDMVLDSRAMAIADVMDDYGRGSKFERGIQGMTRNFGIVSLMAPWNATMKQFAGLITMTRVLRSAQSIRAGKGAAGEIEFLAAGGISEANARTIAEQFAKHGSKEGGVWHANTSAWDEGSRSAIEAFRTAIARDIDRTITTPGQDKPLFMSKDLGRLLFQFKSFAIASTQRTLIAGLQQRDAAVLNGAIMAAGLGTLVHILKQKQAGKEIDIDFDDPEEMAQFLVNGIDRSGLTGWLMDVNNLTEKATRGTIGLSAFTGKPVSRYAMRNITGALAGPTASTIEDAVRGIGAISDGEVRRSEISAIRRLLPYQNLFYFRNNIIDKAEQAIAEGLNAQ